MSHYYEILNSYVVIMYSLVQAVGYGVHYFFFSRFVCALEI